jgi:hypothetical protein
MLEYLGQPLRQQGTAVGQWRMLIEEDEFHWYFYSYKPPPPDSDLWGVIDEQGPYERQQTFELPFTPIALYTHVYLLAENRDEYLYRCSLYRMDFQSYYTYHHHPIDPQYSTGERSTTLSTFT